MRIVTGLKFVIMRSARLLGYRTRTSTEGCTSRPGIQRTSGWLCRTASLFDGGRGEAEWRDGTEIGRRLVTGPSAESVELGDNADVGLTLRHHLDLGWPEVDVVGFLEGCSGTYATASSRPWRMRSAAGSALLW